MTCFNSIRLFLLLPTEWADAVMTSGLECKIRRPISDSIPVYYIRFHTNTLRKGMNPSLLSQIAGISSHGW